MSTESPLQRLQRLDAEDRAERLRQAGQTPPGSPGSKKRQGLIAALVAAALLVLTKGKFVLLLLLTKGKLLLAALKFGPMWTTLWTMGLSIGVYSRFYGWKLAAGVVLSILIHELGHAVVIYQQGLRASAPVFIPFVGAMIALKDQPRTTWQDSLIGAGGPCAGLCAGLATLLIGLNSTGSTAGLFLAIAWITFHLNLFNMIPVLHLDGDRISQPMLPAHWIIGLAGVLALMILTIEITNEVDPAVMFVLFVGAGKGLHRWWKARQAAAGVKGRLVDKLSDEKKYVDEPNVELWQRRASALVYFGLAAILSGLASYTNIIRPVIN